jgi:hypothetical protein
MRRVVLALAFLITGRCVACTIVNPPTPREALKLSAVVFRGTVLSSEALPVHPEMRGRGRYAVTMRVEEYWKGNRGATVKLYVLAPTMDCMGWELEPGKTYLIFASEEGARDYRPDPDFFWYGWTDVLPAGTRMLQPIGTLGGSVSDPLVRNRMRELGRGKRSISGTAGRD